MISDYAWVLPALTVVGWTLSWWHARWTRWAVLSGALAVSVLLLVKGITLPVSPLPPDIGCTREQVQCMDTRPIQWLTAGLLGLACCLILLLVTTVTEIVLATERRAHSGQAPSKSPGP